MPSQTRQTAAPRKSRTISDGVAFSVCYPVEQSELGECQSASCDLPELLLQQHTSQEVIGEPDRAGLLHQQAPFLGSTCA